MRRIERYSPDMDEWTDITEYAKRRFPIEANSGLDRVAEQYARIYQLDVRVVEVKVIEVYKGARGW